MKDVRRALDRLHYYQPVHVLGTGDPIAIALLTAAGADSFDGLEWCRFVLDSRSSRLYPIQNYDFFKWQDEISLIGSRLEDTRNEQQLTWLGKIAVHNVEFYVNFMRKLRRALADERMLVEFMTKLLPVDGMDQVRVLLWRN